MVRDVLNACGDDHAILKSDQLGLRADLIPQEDYSRTASDADRDLHFRSVCSCNWHIPLANRYLRVAAIFSISMDEGFAVKWFKIKSDYEVLSQRFCGFDTTDAARAALIDDGIRV